MMNNREHKTGTSESGSGDQSAIGNGGTNTGAERDNDDLRTRFPDIENDARLKVNSAIPPVPEKHYERPVPQTPQSLLERNPRLKAMSSDMQGIGAGSTIGITLALCIGIGAGLGWAVDSTLLHSKAGGTPWGLIVGFLIGTAAGFVSLIRTANRLNRD